MNQLQPPLENSDLDNYVRTRAFVEVQDSSAEVPARTGAKTNLHLDALERYENRCDFTHITVPQGSRAQCQERQSQP